MLEQFERTELLIGKDSVEKLNNSKIAIFGIGGVGSFVVEALARAGIGAFILVDKDKVDVTNINRQIIATHKTIGISKVDVAKERILSINPKAKVKTYKEFFGKESDDLFDSDISYVVDAVDGSEELCRLASEYAGIPVKRMLFSELGESEKYDGIWACSSILHLPKDELKDVMEKMIRATKNGGYIYTSINYI